MHVNGTWLRRLGYLSLLISAGSAIAALLGQLPAANPLSSYLFAAGLMAVVSGALVVAGRLRDSGDPVAEKIVPSSLVAYLLFVLMMFYWLNQ